MFHQEYHLRGKMLALGKNTHPLRNNVSNLGNFLFAVTYDNLTFFMLTHVFLQKPFCIETL